MKLLIKILSILFGLTLLAAIAAGAVYLYNVIVNLYTSLDVQIAPAFGLGSLVMLLSALAISRMVRETRKRTREQYLGRDKAVLYERVITVLADAHDRGATGLELGDPARGLERSLALRAGPAVLKAYTVLKTLQEDSAAVSPEIRAQFATVLFEMRKDLGLSNQGLKSEELPGIAAMRHGLRPSQTGITDNENVAMSV